MTEGDKAFWGSIIGAAIGALAALLVAIVAVRVDRSNQKGLREKLALREYNNALIMIEGQLNQLITVQMKSKRLLLDCAMLEKPGDFMMTLPRVMALDSTLISSIANNQLVNEWLSLCMNVDITNQLTEDFNAHYKMSRDELYKLQLAKKKPDISTVINDHRTYSELAKACARAIDIERARTLKVLALVHLHGEVSNNKDKKFKSVDEMVKFKFKTSKIAKKANDLSKEFVEEMVFQDV